MRYEAERPGVHDAARAPVESAGSVAERADATAWQLSADAWAAKSPAPLYRSSVRPVASPPVIQVAHIRLPGPCGPPSGLAPPPCARGEARGVEGGDPEEGAHRCLDALRSASRRPAKAWDVPGVEPPEPTRLGEVVWLQPFPCALLEGVIDMPAFGAYLRVPLADRARRLPHREDPRRPGVECDVRPGCAAVGLLVTIGPAGAETGPAAGPTGRYPGVRSFALLPGRLLPFAGSGRSGF
jgi:hypothetical protein